MKKLLPLVLALSSTMAIADNNNGFYLGLKTGSLDIDLSEFDADTPVGIVAGYQQGQFGIEFEANTADVDYDILGFEGTADYETIALYGVYRSDGEFYFKAKAGVLREEIETSFLTEDDTGFSAGIGAGARLGPVSLEAEYTFLESDVNYFSVGANFHF